MTPDKTNTRDAIILAVTDYATGGEDISCTVDRILAALRTAPSPLAPAEGLEAAYKAGFDSGAWCHATFHGWDNASAEAGWQGFKSRAPAPPLTDTPVEGEKLVPWTQPKPDCELCKGSGFYGDRGPGRKGNAEYIRCDCTQPTPLTATAQGPGVRICKCPCGCKRVADGHVIPRSGEGYPECDWCYNCMHAQDKTVHTAAPTPSETLTAAVEAPYYPQGMIKEYDAAGKLTRTANPEFYKITRREEWTDQAPKGTESPYRPGDCIHGVGLCTSSCGRVSK